MKLQSVFAAIAALASALWFGGMVTLGAVVAPLVFRMVPAPTSADAMGQVFRRFDRVALVCVVVVLVCEGGRALVSGAAQFGALLRVGTCAGGAAMALWQALALSPRIMALHASGAVRGLGDTGLELDAVHHLAELSGKVQAGAALLLVVMYAAGAASAGPAGASTAVVSPVD